MTKDCSECKHYDVFHTSRVCHDCKPWGASTDLISRKELIKRINGTASLKVISLDNLFFIINALPSADAVSREEYHELLRTKISFANATILMFTESEEAKPTVIRSRTLMPTKDFKEWAKRIREENPNAIIIPCDAEVVSAETDWIPCSERLPSEIGTIIVTLLDKKYGECFVDDEWWDGDMFLNFGKPTSGYEVIAWMPYPMPYRKGDER